jgi:hypothetical protein
LFVQWKTNTYNIAIPLEFTVGYLKTQLSLLTNVRPTHQKLILKGKLSDEIKISELGLKENQKCKTNISTWIEIFLFFHLLKFDFFNLFILFLFLFSYDDWQ